MNDTDQEALILDSVGRFLEREVKPHVHALEHDDVYPAEIVERMKELGLFGATIAADYGGLGLTTGTYTVRFDECASGYHLTQWYNDEPGPAKAATRSIRSCTSSSVSTMRSCARIGCMPSESRWKTSRTSRD